MLAGRFWRQGQPSVLTLVVRGVRLVIPLRKQLSSRDQDWAPWWGCHHFSPSSTWACWGLRLGRSGQAQVCIFPDSGVMGVSLNGQGLQEGLANRVPAVPAVLSSPPDCTSKFFLQKMACIWGHQPVPLPRRLPGPVCSSLDILCGTLPSHPRPQRRDTEVQPIQLRRAAAHRSHPPDAHS